MTLFALTMDDTRVVVRAKDEVDARMMCVEETKDYGWIDEEVAECRVVNSQGPRRVIVCTRTK